MNYLRLLLILCLLGGLMTGCQNWPSVGPDYQASTFAEGPEIASALNDDGEGGGPSQRNWRAGGAHSRTPC